MPKLNVRIGGASQNTSPLTGVSGSYCFHLAQVSKLLPEK